MIGQAFETFFEYTFEKTRLWIYLGLLYILMPLIIVAGFIFGEDRRRWECLDFLYNNTMIAADRTTYNRNIVPEGDPRIEGARRARCIVRPETDRQGKKAVGLYKYGRSESVKTSLPYVGAGLLATLILHIWLCVSLAKRDRRLAASRVG